MNIIANLEKYKHLLTPKVRILLINFLIITSLSFVLLKNIELIRYKFIYSENGEIFILDRFTSEIKGKK